MPRRTDLCCDLPRPLPARPASLGQGDRVAQLTLPAGATGAPGTLLGGPANGTWKLYVYNNTAGGGAAEIDTAKLTLHTTAGPERIARTASWTSPVIDVETPVATIDGVTSVQRAPDGTGLKLLVRSCQQADCGDGVWTPALDQPAAIAPARYLQLRVEMSSAGVTEPELQSLRIQAH